VGLAAAAPVSDEMIGQEISHYTILEELGQGGMGRVYLAHDTVLDRKVALKFLPDEMQKDSKARRRFLTEAKCAAATAHPYICKIYEISKFQGRDFISMEYVQGHTLEDILTEDLLPLKRILEIAIEIAEALESAHQAGVVHRDLKPSNIMVTADNHVKVMDFGLAKRIPTVAHHDQVDASALTKDGSIMGTIPYMSPEQARGLSVDARSDIFSFGTILYEMVAGIHPFHNFRSLELISAILDHQAPLLSRSHQELPEGFQDVVSRMMAKNVDDRYQSVHAVRTELIRMLESIGAAQPRPVAIESPQIAGLPSTNLSREGKQIFAAGTVSDTPGTIAANLYLDARPRKRVRAIWITFSGLIVVSSLLARSYLTRSPVAADVVRFQIYPPQHATFYAGAVPKISPDGRYLAFIAVSDSKRRIWIQALDSYEAQPLQGTDDPVNLFWSRDSRSIGFFARPSQLKRVEVSGGMVRTLTELPSLSTGWQGGTWNRDGVILISMAGDFYTVPGEGGTLKKLSLPSRTRHFLSERVWPHFLPNSRQFVYSTASPEMGFQKAGIYLGSLDSPTVQLLDGETVASAVADSSGHVLYVRQGVLVAEPFDLRRKRVTGDPVPLAENAGFSLGFGFSSAMSASDTGVLTYWGGYGRFATQLTWFDRAGRPLHELAPPGDYYDVELSSDAKRVGAEILDPKVGSADIWLLDATQGISSRFTFDANWDFGLQWSSDAAATIYTSVHAGGNTEIRRRSSTGGLEEILVQEPTELLSTDWSLDGRLIFYEKRDSNTGWDIWVLPLDGDHKPYPFLNTVADEGMARLSPDRKWIAYGSTETGRPEIFVRNFPDNGAKWQISTSGGSGPRWRRDGRELFYVGGDGKLVAVPIDAGPAFSYGAGHALDVKVRPSRPGWGRFGYDVTADGQKFLVNRLVENPVPIPISVVVNWTAALK
jgi:serine/threonine protein kinase